MMDWIINERMQNIPGERDVINYSSTRGTTKIAEKVHKQKKQNIAESVKTYRTFAIHKIA